jgi:predicted Zn-ribbon and HTH transcriptional regulator
MDAKVIEKRMYRKELIGDLLERPCSIPELASLKGAAPGAVKEDVQHLLRSLAHMPYRAVIERAECRKCGFRFGENKITKPGKCPQCKATWIQEPRIALERTDR